MTALAVNSTRRVTDAEVLEFYNLATSKILTGLEVCYYLVPTAVLNIIIIVIYISINPQEDLSKAQSGKNFKLLITYFNMIQMIESSGIGLVYGLRFYATGKLSENEIISYVRTNALLYEYYKQAREMIPNDIGKVLHKAFNSEEFQIVNTRYGEKYC